MAQSADPGVVTYPAPDLRLAGAHAGPGQAQGYPNGFGLYDSTAFLVDQPPVSAAVSVEQAAPRGAGGPAGWGIGDQAVGARQPAKGQPHQPSHQASNSAKDERAAKLMALEHRLKALERSLGGRPPATGHLLHHSHPSHSGTSPLSPASIALNLVQHRPALPKADSAPPESRPPSQTQDRSTALSTSAPASDPVAAQPKGKQKSGPAKRPYTSMSNPAGPPCRQGGGGLARAAPLRASWNGNGSMAYEGGAGQAHQLQYGVPPLQQQQQSFHHVKDPLHSSSMYPSPEATYTQADVSHWSNYTPQAPYGAQAGLAQPYDSYDPYTAVGHSTAFLPYQMTGTYSRSQAQPPPFVSQASSIYPSAPPKAAPAPPLPTYSPYNLGTPSQSTQPSPSTSSYVAPSRSSTMGSAPPPALAPLSMADVAPAAKQEPYATPSPGGDSPIYEPPWEYAAAERAGGTGKDASGRYWEAVTCAGGDASGLGGDGGGGGGGGEGWTENGAKRRKAW